MNLKIISTFFFISIFSLVACHRSESTAKEISNSNSPQGAWELRILHGGYGPPGRNPYYKPGNGHIWSFKDSTFKHYEAGTLSSSGTFTLDRDTCPATQTLMDAFIRSNSFGFKTFFEISEDTLTMYVGLIPADGYIAKYVRINNSSY